MKIFYDRYEAKFQTLEKERPDEMEMAKKETQKGKAQEKGKESKI